jgi:hypothetical protein
MIVAAGDRGPTRAGNCPIVPDRSLLAKSPVPAPRRDFDQLRPNTPTGATPRNEMTAINLMRPGPYRVTLLQKELWR